MSGQVIEMRAIRADGEWADLIRDAWGQSVAGIIRTAKLLAEAKAAIGDGGWTTMVRRDLPFSVRTAQMLCSIAANPVLCEANHGSRLPASWRSLYELSRWEPEELAIGLHHECYVRPDLGRADLPKVRARVRAKLAAGEPQNARRRPSTPQPAQDKRAKPFLFVLREILGADLLRELDDVPHSEQRVIANAISEMAKERLQWHSLP